MELYHGSTQIIKRPEFGKGNIHNDYGLGFYCTENPELAKEWACPEQKNGFVNKYFLDSDNLQIMNLNSNDYHILNWIAILLKNRIFVKKAPIAKQAEEYILGEFLPDLSGYDVICGYRADDSYFAYAKDFLNNIISLKQLSHAMRLGNLGNQVVLVSENAFQRLDFLEYDVADAEIYYYRRQIREVNAREMYLHGYERKNVNLEQEKYIIDLMRNGVKNDDRCLREGFSG